MTTIAWKGKVLATDSLVQQAGVKQFTSKLYRVKWWKTWQYGDSTQQSVFAGAGYVQDSVAVVEWLNKGSPLGQRPNVDSTFTALIMEPNGVCWKMEDGLVPMPVVGDWIAVGTGRDFASAAMHLGKSADEAVLVATALDISSGGDVQYVSFLD